MSEKGSLTDPDPVDRFAIAIADIPPRRGAGI
jgi:hypothetical protein